MPAQKLYKVSKRSGYPFVTRVTSLRALVSNQNLRKLQATRKGFKKNVQDLYVFFRFVFLYEAKKV